MSRTAFLICLFGIFLTMWCLFAMSLAGSQVANRPLLIDEPDVTAGIFPAGGDWCDIPVQRRRAPRAKSGMDPLEPYGHDQRTIA